MKGSKHVFREGDIIEFNGGYGLAIVPNDVDLIGIIEYKDADKVGLSLARIKEMKDKLRTKFYMDEWIHIDDFIDALNEVFEGV